MKNETPDAKSPVASPVDADPRCTWKTWDDEADHEVVELVETFDPTGHAAGRAASEWLKNEAQGDIFTVTHVLVSEVRVEGFITCRVSEATLTWGGLRSLGGRQQAKRKQVPAYLLCWCAKHRNAQISGEELVLNAIRLGREVSAYGCVVLALDPHDDVCAGKVWREKYGFRQGSVPGKPETARLWTPLSAA